MSDPEAAWFAIRTKPSKEQVARLHYERQGFVVYLPQLRVVRRHARRREEVLRPFFPGYLFLRLAPAERNWVAIASTRGAIGAVCFGDQYVPVPDGIILGLKAQEENGTIPLIALKRERLQPGMKVSVQLDSGAVAPATIFSMSGKENVVVLLNLLSRQVRASVPLDRVESG